MKKLINWVANTSLAALGNILLIGTSIVIGICGIGLTALYLATYIDTQSPQVVRLKCAVGIQHPDCNNYQQELDDLAAERAALAAELAKLKQRFSNLEAIERSVDTINLFEHKPLQDSTLKLTVGSVYSALTDGGNGFQEHFCYISLGRSGHSNQVDRNLYLRNHNGDVAVDSATLSKNNISAAAYASAREQCQPMLIGG